MSRRKNYLVSMNNQHRLRFAGRDFLTLIGRRDFPSLMYYVLQHRWPGPREASLFELMLKISIDHGSDTPSAIATIAAAKNGKSLPQAVAAGVAALNEAHGGAIEPCMKLLYQKVSSEAAAAKLFRLHKKVPGVGHRLYKISDPRAELLLTAVKKSVAAQKYYRQLKAITTAYCRLADKPAFPINIDGAMAVILCSLKFTPEAGRAVFIAARVNGLLGQALAHLKSRS